MNNLIIIAHIILSVLSWGLTVYAIGGVFLNLFGLTELQYSYLLKKESLQKFVKNWKEKHTTVVTIEEYYLHPANAITKLSSEEWKESN